jgi:DNA-directed RNA polymerase
MINDINLARYVNLVKSNQDDLPNDVYGFMVNRVKDEINNLVKNENEFIKLNYLNIDRSFIKRCIMTISYGVTIRGVIDQLKSDQFKLVDRIKGKNTYTLKINKDNNFYFYLNDKEIYQLSKIMHNILYKTFPSLSLLVEYLKNINRLLKSLNLNTI